MNLRSSRLLTALAGWAALGACQAPSAPMPGVAGNPLPRPFPTVESAAIPQAAEPDT
ncbi:MAG: hypothetical protein R3E96_06870 [Planctomycetota bacterium]